MVSNGLNPKFALTYANTNVNNTKEKKPILANHKYVRIYNTK